MARRREQASFKETIIEGESSFTHVGNYEKRRRLMCSSVFKLYGDAGIQHRFYWHAGYSVIRVPSAVNEQEISSGDDTLHK